MQETLETQMKQIKQSIPTQNRFEEEERAYQTVSCSKGKASMGRYDSPLII